MATVSLYYWAGAKAAAGTDLERFEAPSVADALEQARAQRADSRFDQVLQLSSVLIDGLVAHDVDLLRELDAPVRVEILPPFAGGNGRERVSERD